MPAWILKFLLDIAFAFYHLSILIFFIDFSSLNMSSMTFVCGCLLVKWEPLNDEVCVLIICLFPGAYWCLAHREWMGMNEWEHEVEYSFNVCLVNMMFERIVWFSSFLHLLIDVRVSLIFLLALLLMWEGIYPLPVIFGLTNSSCLRIWY